MDRVFICSPYRGDETANTFNAREYCKLAISKGFLPIAPHLYFTQFFNEEVEAERDQGIAMGLELLDDCTQVWAFYNPEVGPSEGMLREMSMALAKGIPVITFSTEVDE